VPELFKFDVKTQKPQQPSIMSSKASLSLSPERGKEERLNSGVSSRARDLAHKIMRERAAVTIQVWPPLTVILSTCTNVVTKKNYRGYRARRQLNGLGLDPPTRWSEVIT
jgi:hypothetical protein